MHALARAADVLEVPMLHTWAVELAAASHAGFAHRPGGGGAAPVLYWKMSIDLSRPLVPSQGAHDPLDGFITCSALGAPELGPEVDELWSMLRPSAWPGDDPLGLGGLLADVWSVAQLLDRPGADRVRLEPLLSRLVDASLVSLRAVVGGVALRHPLERRLAFRELGLVIGLRALQAFLDSRGGAARSLAPESGRFLERHLPLAEELTATWSTPEARRMDDWLAHEDINDVMLATALAPDEAIRV
jgi:hypothetical protein